MDRYGIVSSAVQQRRKRIDRKLSEMFGRKCRNGESNDTRSSGSLVASSVESRII